MGARLAQVICLVLCVWAPGSAQIHYAIPEELEHGAFVGNIAEDLGFDVAKLSARRFRIVSGARKHYLDVSLENGILFVNEKIDREELCEQTVSCFMHLQVVSENPLELYRVEVEILDVNDNSPSFPWSEFNLDVSESAAPGSRYPLESAQDQDAGTNSLRSYLLSVNEHFALEVQARSDGSKFAELVLQTPLDRERQKTHHMVLTAVDGGAPERSGTAQITVTVLDANDNAPVFDQSFYRVSLMENVPRGFLVIKLNASDLDEGSNADISYSFSGHVPLQVRQLFSVDSSTGEIRVKGTVDYEKARIYEIYVQAKDKGPYPVAVHCKVLVSVLDTNDNLPEVILTSVSTPVREDAPPGTVIAVISLRDRDSGDNGHVECHIPQNVPFQLHSSFTNYYTLITSDFLDRESVPQYNLTVTARDRGFPPLSASRTVSVQVSDINDNTPRFLKPSYAVYVSENNAPGASLCSVSASDPDAGQNAFLSYSVLEGRIQGMPASTYVSINSDSGSIYALRSFDHEQLAEFQIGVGARDAGVPALSSRVTVSVFVVDQNDNAPVILSPRPLNGSAPTRTLPRAAAAGHLVATVTAVDADVGQNSRLSYQILQATDLSLFSVALYTGEIRTLRRALATDAGRQRLLVSVKDSGQPPLSATVSIILSLVDGAPEPVPGPGDLSLRPQRPSRLTLYLSVSVGCVVLLLLAGLALSALKLRRPGLSLRRCCGPRPQASAGAKKSNLNVQVSAASRVPTSLSLHISTAPNMAASRAGRDGTAPGPLSTAYCYKMCLTPDSTRTDFMFLKPNSAGNIAPQNNAQNCGPANRTPHEGELCSTRVGVRAWPGGVCDTERAASPGAGQYWTWGCHRPACGVAMSSGPPRYVTTATQHPPEPQPDDQHSPAPGQSQLDVKNSFSTFGKEGHRLGHAHRHAHPE
ncbi:protocadherin-10-like [Conger conger]|uniref:protocadherin-10-like n=1 Tax=Conger conger TaxID=82655 RepID=UPI002A5AC1DD|nr:protocadherin-10-like [Conger conger]